MSKETYHPSNLKPLVAIIARVLGENPGVWEHKEELYQVLADKIPGFHDESKCVNCGASMAEYVFEFDVLDAILLYHMAQAVRRSMGSHGEDAIFTLANKVRVQTLLGVSYAIKSRTTQCAKLGLIAKLTGQNGKHIPGMWVVTTRGWAALRGEPIPRAVRVFRGKILERTDQLITISDAFNSHRSKVESTIHRKKNPKTDYREYIATYEPSEWVHIAGMHEGVLV